MPAGHAPAHQYPEKTGLMRQAINSGRTFQPTSLSNTITFDRYAFVMGRLVSP